MVDATTEFFENCEMTPEDTDIGGGFLKFLEEILQKLILTRESDIIPQKRLAYCRYKCHLLYSSEDMGVFEFKVTSANIHNSKLLITLFLSISSTNVVKQIKEMYSDDAYSAEQNRKLLMEYDIIPLFHTKK